MGHHNFGQIFLSEALTLVCENVLVLRETALYIHTNQWTIFQIGTIFWRHARWNDFCFHLSELSQHFSTLPVQDYCGEQNAS